MALISPRLTGINDIEDTLQVGIHC
jgi:hypothetical protein